VHETRWRYARCVGGQYVDIGWSSGLLQHYNWQWSIMDYRASILSAKLSA
jgi:hypothetical protein